MEDLQSLMDGMPQYRYLSNDTSVYDRLTSHLVEDGFYSITASLWDDIPCSHCLLLVFRYSANYVVQIAVEQLTGRMFTRVVHRTKFTIYRDWVTPEGIQITTLALVKKDLPIALRINS